MEWKTGDWVVFDRAVGQIKEIGGDGWEFSDGFCCTSGGRLAERFRPLSLTNKRIVQTFEIYYKRLDEIDGHRGFNWPDISRYFSQLALDAIDDVENTDSYDKAQQFIKDARDRNAVIQGVALFQPTRRAVG